MSKLKDYLFDENGEVMLESTIVMIFTLFLLIAIISVGFLFYQQAMINTVASDLATDVATSYKLTNKEIGSNNISSNALNDVKLYRTSFAISNMKALHKQAAEDYLPERINLTTLGLTKNEPEVKNFDIKIDNIGRMHVEITVSMQCDILFGGALEYFGIIDSTPTFEATGRAECLDITAYASHVQFLEYVGRKIKGTNADQAISSIIGIFQDADSISELLLGN